MAAGVSVAPEAEQQQYQRVPELTTSADLLLSCHETMEEDEEEAVAPFGSPRQPRRPQQQDDSSTNAPPVKALRDMTLVEDDRILQNLLQMEKSSLPSAPDYFRFVQKDLRPPMRRIVAEWMLQVCQELQCQPEVFTLAMNYMDRFLARCRVRKASLQLLGSVCLMVASKFKETCPVLGERLIFYSDFSIGSEELKVGRK